MKINPLSFNTQPAFKGVTVDYNPYRGELTFKTDVSANNPKLNTQGVILDEVRAGVKEETWRESTTADEWTRRFEKDVDRVNHGLGLGFHQMIFEKTRQIKNKAVQIIRDSALSETEQQGAIHIIENGNQRDAASYPVYEQNKMVTAFIFGGASVPPELR